MNDYKKKLNAQKAKKATASSSKIKVVMQWLL